MTSHLGLMVIFSLFVSVVFSVLTRDDPKEQIVAVYMSQAPSPIRAAYRRLIKQLVYQAID